VSPPLSANQVVEQLWTERLVPHIDQLFKSDPSAFKLNKHSSYRDVIRICKMGKSEELANRLTLKLNELIEEQIESLKNKVTEIAADNEDSMQIDQGTQPAQAGELALLRDFWLHFCRQLRSVCDIFIFLEKTYLVSGQNMTQEEVPSSPLVRNLSPCGFSSFWQIGLNFLRFYMSQIELKDKLISGILDLIKQERQNSKQETRDIMKKLVHILLAL